MQEKLLQEQVTVHSELCVPAALSEDRQALKGSSVLGCVPNIHTEISTTAPGQHSPTQLLSCSGLEEPGDGNGSGCVALCSQAD